MPGGDGDYLSLLFTENSTYPVRIEYNEMNGNRITSYGRERHGP